MKGSKKPRRAEVEATLKGARRIVACIGGDEEDVRRLAEESPAVVRRLQYLTYDVKKDASPDEVPRGDM